MCLSSLQVSCNPPATHQPQAASSQSTAFPAIAEQEMSECGWVVHGPTSIPSPATLELHGMLKSVGIQIPAGMALRIVFESGDQALSTWPLRAPPHQPQSMLRGSILVDGVSMKLQQQLPESHSLQNGPGDVAVLQVSAPNPLVLQAPTHPLSPTGPAPAVGMAGSELNFAHMASSPVSCLDPPVCSTRTGHSISHPVPEPHLGRPVSRTPRCASPLRQPASAAASQPSSMCL